MMTLEEKCEYFRLNVCFLMRESQGLKHSSDTKKALARWEVLTRKYEAMKLAEAEAEALKTE
jgi:hypothetical protein